MPAGCGSGEGVMEADKQGFKRSPLLPSSKEGGAISAVKHGQLRVHLVSRLPLSPRQRTIPPFTQMGENGVPKDILFLKSYVVNNGISFGFTDVWLWQHIFSTYP